jgi:ribosomal subunit interface protein
MKLPVEITFRDMPVSEALEENIREKVEKLEQFCDHITSCRVVIETSHQHKHKGNLYHIRIDLTVPGQELVVSRDPSENLAHADAYVAVRDAFTAARRQLEKYVQSNRRDEKAHRAVKGNGATPPARIMELIPMQDYGRLLTHEGREIYFHRNSLVNGDFDKLSVGDMVRFNEEMGDDGPQASSVHLLS